MVRRILNILSKNALPCTAGDGLTVIICFCPALHICHSVVCEILKDRCQLTQNRPNVLGFLYLQYKSSLVQILCGGLRPIVFTLRQ